MASLLEEQLQVEVDIERGGFGEFSVMVGDRRVVRRTSILLPSEQEILAGVRAELHSASESGGLNSSVA